MEDYLHRGGLPADEEVRRFIEDLAVDALLADAGTAHRVLFRACTLLDLPVPTSVIETLSDALGGSPTRLRGLGLLDPYPDVFDPGSVALAANPLAAGRVDALSAEEKPALAATVLDRFFAAWGGPAPPGGRAGTLDLQLVRLGIEAGNAAVVAATAAGGIRPLRSGPVEVAAELGGVVIALLDRHDVAPPLDLLRACADAAITSGDGAVGTRLLERAVEQIDAGVTAADPLERARDLFTAGNSDGGSCHCIGRSRGYRLRAG